MHACMFIISRERKNTAATTNAGSNATTTYTATCTTEPSDSTGSAAEATETATKSSSNWSIIRKSKPKHKAPKFSNLPLQYKIPLFGYFSPFCRNIPFT